MKAETISMHPGDKPALEWVPVDRIHVDHNYQRELRPARVKQILREFHWSRFTPVQLSERGDGTFNVFDGQHRVEAARLHPLIDAVPASIVTLDGIREEAGAFLGVNVNRSAVSTIEKYHAGLEAGDPEMMRICSVLEEAGCEVVPAQGIGLKANRTQAVTAVGRTIKYYGEGATASSCELLRTAWPDDVHAQKGVLIQALARLLRGNASASKARLQQVLSATTRQALSSDAETIRKISGGDAAHAIARTICDLYNKGLSKNQILIGARAR
ncbi:DUF6551 family protein [Pararhizobium haloflavum]|uniref:DUF6551 family protein n=1 Tax=Pararhizobium haloflavum TaxID=2037914 RepID=UPI000C179E21|nr:DUF6551 family protein [Pararhizobium haloflavum]